MNIITSLLISLLAGLSTIIGSLLIFIPIKKEHINKFITLSLGFSLSVMICISIFDLLPESIKYLYKKYNIIVIILILIAFIISYILIKVINKLIKKNENNLYKLGILSMITLMLHNIPEGILTFLSSMQNIKIGIKMAIAIALHNIPEGIAIGIPIYYASKSKIKAINKTFISGISEFIGALFAYIFIARHINDEVINIILILVGSIMITLAIEEIFPESIKYKENKFMIVGLILGAVISIISIIL